MAEGRRIIYDDEDKQIYDKLRSGSGIFNNLSITDLFAVALIYGKKEGKRTELGKGAIGRVRSETLKTSPVKDLMMVIAVDETGSMDVLSDENEYFRICEEYAKTGTSSPYLFLQYETALFTYFDQYVKIEVIQIKSGIKSISSSKFSSTLFPSNVV